jgi:putative flippase GtrA
MASLPQIVRSRRHAVQAGVASAWGRVPRFVRNALISLPTFLIDLGLLFLLVRRGHLNYLAATVAAFFVANALGYFLARWLVFVGTKRGLRVGFVYFLAIAILSAVALMTLMWVAVSVFHLDVIVSRVVAASVVGIGGYVLNLVFNFRVARTQDAPIP